MRQQVLAIKFCRWWWDSLERKRNKFVIVKLSRSRSVRLAKFFKISYYYFARSIFFKFHRALSCAARELAIRAWNKFYVRASAWKSTDDRNHAIRSQINSQLRRGRGINPRSFPRQTSVAHFANALARPAIRIRVHSSFTPATLPRTFTVT